MSTKQNKQEESKPVTPTPPQRQFPLEQPDSEKNKKSTTQHSTSK